MQPNDTSREGLDGRVSDVIVRTDETQIRRSQIHIVLIFSSVNTHRKYEIHALPFGPA